MTSSQRQMALIGFVQAQNCSTYVSSWRHPSTMQDFLTPEYYQRIARTLEDGKFQMAFFDDRLAMPDAYGKDFRAAVEYGIRPVKLDLISIATAVGLATTRLGVGATYSTTYHAPYQTARVFATLDLMLRGRAAWNVVTSLNDSEAANFGLEESLPHDLRYDRADEYMSVVHGHWDTWEPGAIAMDRRTGRFGDPDMVHPLEHEGRWLRSRGPFTVPRSQQGNPVIMQAGQSGRGRAFAARWAELIFVLYPNIQLAQNFYRDFKAQVAALGRDPDHVLIAPAINVIVGETKAIAEAKIELLEGLSEPIDGLALLSEVMNFDFATKGIDEAFSDEELASISGLQAIRDKVVRLSGKQNPTVRDFVTFSGKSGIREHPLFAGTPQEVADELEAWFTSQACDGFVLTATHMPGGYEDFVRLVVPELQRRGLHQADYRGATLRENLGFPNASIGDWRLPAAVG